MKQPLHYAVVVGINTYPGGFAKLNGPVNDARAFAHWLKSPHGGGLPVRNVRTVLSPSRATMMLRSAKPTKAMVDDALWELVQAAREAMAALPEEEQGSARDRSRLYIFVAGHGIMPGSGEAALLDAVAEPDRKTNLELRSYIKWFELDGTFGEICIFADCCRTFELLANVGAPSFDQPGRLGGQVFTLVGWAASAGRLAFEDDQAIAADDKRGYFARALVDGLRGNATDPATGLVTSAVLQTYVSQVVAARSASKGKYLRQSVSMPVDTHLMTFGPRRRTRAVVSPRDPPGVPGRQRRRVHIRFPDGFSDPVELVAPDGSMTYWDAADGPWTLWLYDASWVIQRAGTKLDTAGFANDGAFAVIGDDTDVQL